MSITVDVTHLVSYSVGETSYLDALATETVDASTTRRFVPGFLPCGECGRCRRALVGACASPRRPLLPVTEGETKLELPARFVAPVDEPADAARLAPAAVALAGPLAFATFALATANVVPGDVTFWLGDGVLATLGLAASRNAGARAFGWSSRAPFDPEAMDSDQAADGHGTRKRIVFVLGTDAEDWANAERLGEPGSTIVQLGPRSPGQPLPLRDLPLEARLICLSAYHPDFLPEAFAALRRDPGLTDLVRSVATGETGAGVIRLALEAAPAATQTSL
ncbi:MAG TPA: hypothetical protein VGF45_16965 [Polyangia bacterium]